jgi:HPt (histidine-containing phosphotransfer) domain-containing protein
VFVTQVHSLKSASASIGADEISAKAAKLEAAGKNADINFIQEHLPVFVQQLAELVINIKKILEYKKSDDTSEPSLLTDNSPLFEELAEALKKQNAAEIDRLLAELDKISPDSETREALEKISDEVLMTEFDNALKIVNNLISEQTK